MRPVQDTCSKDEGWRGAPEEEGLRTVGARRRGYKVWVIDAKIVSKEDPAAGEEH